MPNPAEQGVDRARVSDQATTEPQASDINPFSPETEQVLTARGYTIFDLCSVQSPHWGVADREGETFPSHVAVKTQAVFIPDSENKTLDEQKEMVTDYSRQLGIPGVEAIAVNVTTALRLNAVYRKQNRERSIYWENDASARTVSRTTYPKGKYVSIGDTINHIVGPVEYDIVALYIDEHEGWECPPEVVVGPIDPNEIGKHIKMPAVLVPASTVPAIS